MSEGMALWAEIDLSKIRRNVQTLKSLLSPPTTLLGVVKANAYGHGAVAVSPAILEAGAEWLAVARVREAEALRAAGISAPLLLLAEPPSPLLKRVVELELVTTLYTFETADQLANVAGSSGRPRVHLKVDTGMHRYGVLPDDFLKFFEHVDRLEGIEVTGIWSHLAFADEPDNPNNQKQLEKFMEVIEALGPRAEGLIKHVSSSAGMLSLPDAGFDMVRAGISLYGIHPSEGLAGAVPLEPALTLKSKVGLVKRIAAEEPISYRGSYVTKSDTQIATVPCGYADGLRRGLSGRADILINGRRYRIAAITMDHFMVDIGDDDVVMGDEVVIIGTQNGESITADELARAIDTISYEIVTGIGAGVPRVYLNGK
jgi:alanine racemase